MESLNKNKRAYKNDEKHRSTLERGKVIRRVSERVVWGRWWGPEGWRLLLPLLVLREQIGCHLSVGKPPVARSSNLQAERDVTLDSDKLRLLQSLASLRCTNLSLPLFPCRSLNYPKSFVSLFSRDFCRYSSFYLIVRTTWQHIRCYSRYVHPNSNPYHYSPQSLTFRTLNCLWSIISCNWHFIVYKNNRPGNTKTP